MNNAYSAIAGELRESGVRLVAVSKTKSPEEILSLYSLGQRDFGENRVQELRMKKEQLPADIRWHLIGHPQTNKVKIIAPWIAMIHSVDSKELLAEIEKSAVKCGRIIDCLLQVYIADEETKFGFDAGELKELLNSGFIASQSHVRICGLMGMATNTDNWSKVRNEFKGLKQLFNELKQTYFADIIAFRELSMGMSSDYKIAVEEGATMVRIGSLLFGER